MSRWLSEILRRPFRSLWPVALATFAPKCVVCLLAYAGIGAILGLGDPKICGATAGSTGSWVASLALFGLAVGIVGLLAGFRSRRHKG